METSTRFIVGDLVHLNSGSPDSKVVGLEGGKVDVEWYSEDGEAQKLVLPSVCFHWV